MSFSEQQVSGWRGERVLEVWVYNYMWLRMWVGEWLSEYCEWEKYVWASMKVRQSVSECVSNIMCGCE